MSPKLSERGHRVYTVHRFFREVHASHATLFLMLSNLQRSMKARANLRPIPLSTNLSEAYRERHAGTAKTCNLSRDFYTNFHTQVISGSPRQCAGELGEQTKKILEFGIISWYFLANKFKQANCIFFWKFELWMSELPRLDRKARRAKFQETPTCAVSRDSCCLKKQGQTLQCNDQMVNCRCSLLNIVSFSIWANILAGLRYYIHWIYQLTF